MGPLSQGQRACSAYAASAALVAIPSDGIGDGRSLIAYGRELHGCRAVACQRVRTSRPEKSARTLRRSPSASASMGVAPGIILGISM